MIWIQSTGQENNQNKSKFGEYECMADAASPFSGLEQRQLPIERRTGGRAIATVATLLRGDLGLSLAHPRNVLCLSLYFSLYAAGAWTHHSPFSQKENGGSTDGAICCSNKLQGRATP